MSLKNLNTATFHFSSLQYFIYQRNSLLFTCGWDSFFGVASYFLPSSAPGFLRVAGEYYLKQKIPSGPKKIAAGYWKTIPAKRDKKLFDLYLCHCNDHVRLDFLFFNSFVCLLAFLFCINNNPPIFFGKCNSTIVCRREKKNNKFG